MFNYYRLSSVFRRLAFAGLASVGLTYSRQADVAKIHDLFRRLWPQRTGLELRRCGAYLIPQDLGRIDILFSPGVGPNSDFELDFAERGIPCHLADASVSAPAVPHPNFRFQKKYIGVRSDGDFVGLEDWIVSNYPEGRDAVLQMDIEGFEFETLLALPPAILGKFKMIVLEVHYLNFLASQEGLTLGFAFFNHLLRDFTVAHFHMNNFLRPVQFRGLAYPADLELTLIRNDLVQALGPVESIPHPLDMKNNPRKRDYSFHRKFQDGVVAG